MKHIKNKKRNQNTESPKTTRQDAPEKTQQNQKTRATKTILTSFDYLVFS